MTERGLVIPVIFFEGVRGDERSGRGLKKALTSNLCLPRRSLGEGGTSDL
jgi:hypothetical protein